MQNFLGPRFSFLESDWVPGFSQGSWIYILVRANHPALEPRPRVWADAYLCQRRQFRYASKLQSMFFQLRSYQHSLFSASSIVTSSIAAPSIATSSISSPSVPSINRPSVPSFISVFFCVSHPEPEESTRLTYFLSTLPKASAIVKSFPPHRTAPHLNSNLFLYQQTPCLTKDLQEYIYPSLFLSFPQPPSLHFSPLPNARKRQN
ncbi:hypothetical protein BJY04DRAFT_104482 [Aspergillus karnatakaensis]|uniref:uncharacterized protein n=1 Tax=Aspergillus karnatakaensis TaxID=1810916 RepID=UPI003CCD5A7A